MTAWSDDQRAMGRLEADMVWVKEHIEAQGLALQRIENHIAQERGKRHTVNKIYGAIAGAGMAILVSLLDWLVFRKQP